MSTPPNIWWEIEEWIDDLLKSGQSTEQVIKTVTAAYAGYPDTENFIRVYVEKQQGR